MQKNVLQMVCRKAHRTLCFAALVLTQEKSKSFKSCFLLNEVFLFCQGVLVGTLGLPVFSTPWLQELREKEKEHLAEELKREVGGWVKDPAVPVGGFLLLWCEVIPRFVRVKDLDIHV